MATQPSGILSARPESGFDPNKYSRERRAGDVYIELEDGTVLHARNRADAIRQLQEMDKPESIQ